MVEEDRLQVIREYVDDLRAFIAKLRKFFH